MPALNDLWINSRDELKSKKVKQIIAIAGNGDIKDDSETSLEFRSFLKFLPSELLISYANECLEESFTNSGFVLQDIINEVGARIGYTVENGRYRGIKGEIGFDGIWTSPIGHKLLIEVKTTDAYRIDLDTISNYRNEIIKKNDLNDEDISILMVVGRNDTGGLEEQVRGSKHAWNIRLISVDSLLKLVLLKDKIDDPNVYNKLFDLLIPREYTKLDKIIEILFFTSHDDSDIDNENDEDLFEIEKTTNKKDKKFIPVKFRDLCIEVIEKYFNEPFERKSFGLFISNKTKKRILCSISREYDKGNNKFGYWFSIHPYQKEYLEQTELSSYVALGCGSEKEILLFESSELFIYIDKMNKTERNNKHFWHVRVNKKDDKYFLILKKEFDDIEITKKIINEKSPI